MNDKTKSQDAVIRSRPVASCPVCGSPGCSFLNKMTDEFFHSPGEWDSKKCSNPKCRTVWLDPQPLETDIHKAYKNYLISHQEIDDGRDQVNGLYQRVQRGYWFNRYGYGDSVTSLDRILGRLVYLYPLWRGALDVNVFFLNKQQGGRLLEIGCGAGRHLKLMQELGWRAEGVDADPVVAEKARNKGLAVSQGYVYEQEYPDETFDAIVLNHVIEHVYELDRFLGELYRILKPGGRLIMVTPNIESFLSKRKMKSFYVQFMDTPRHLYVFTPASLSLLTARAGFSKARVFTTSRHVGYIYMSDKSLERTGNWVLQNPPPAKDRMGAIGIFFLEWLLKKVKRDAGEEIVFVGEK